MVNWRELENKNSKSTSGEAVENNVNKNTDLNRNDSKNLDYRMVKEDADNGNSKACFIYGTALLTGEIGKNLDSQIRNEQILKYLKTAANFGMKDAQYLLGEIYEGLFSRCSIKNIEEAILYYNLAARQNDKKAQFRLSILEFQTKRSNWVHWLCCAHLNGLNEATELINDLLSRSQDADKDYDMFEWHINNISKNGIIPR